MDTLDPENKIAEAVQDSGLPEATTASSTAPEGSGLPNSGEQAESAGQLTSQTEPSQYAKQPEPRQQRALPESGLQYPGQPEPAGQYQGQPGPCQYSGQPGLRQYPRQPGPGQYPGHPGPGSYDSGQQGSTQYPSGPPPGYHSKSGAGLAPGNYETWSQGTTVVVHPDTQPLLAQQTRIVPSDYLCLAILACLCCFWPLGLAAIVFACAIRSSIDSGDYRAAAANARTSKILTIASCVVGVFDVIAILLFMVFKQQYD